jgi:arsenate reductase
MRAQEDQIIIYGIKNCDTIKKTKKWFDSKHVNYFFHDFKTLGCEESIAQSMLKKLGHHIVINRRGTTWRKIPQTERETITDETALELIINCPTLIKRPVIKRKGIWLVGYNELDFEKICSLALNPSHNEKNEGGI